MIRYLRTVWGVGAHLNYLILEGIQYPHQHLSTYHLVNDGRYVLRSYHDIFSMALTNDPHTFVLSSI